MQEPWTKRFSIFPNLMSLGSSQMYSFGQTLLLCIGCIRRVGSLMQKYVHTSCLSVVHALKPLVPLCSEFRQQSIAFLWSVLHVCGNNALEIHFYTFVQTHEIALFIFQAIMNLANVQSVLDGVYSRLIPHHSRCPWNACNPIICFSLYNTMVTKKLSSLVGSNAHSCNLYLLVIREGNIIMSKPKVCHSYATVLLEPLFSLSCWSM